MKHLQYRSKTPEPCNASTFSFGCVRVLVLPYANALWRLTVTSQNKTYNKPLKHICLTSKMCWKQHSQQFDEWQTKMGIYIFFNLTSASPPILPLPAFLRPPSSSLSPLHSFVFRQYAQRAVDLGRGQALSSCRPCAAWTNQR